MLLNITTEIYSASPWRK